VALEPAGHRTAGPARSRRARVPTDGVSAGAGADLGVRQEWLPLFDEYHVDLVVCGHEHDYERTLPIRGHQNNATLTPIPRATATDVIDTEQGTVHMVIGGGGTSAPSNALLFEPPQCRVIVSVGAPDPTTGQTATELRLRKRCSLVCRARKGPGLRVRRIHRRPGTTRGGRTTTTITYYEVTGPYGQLNPSKHSP
jgi:hypothetical protein